MAPTIPGRSIVIPPGGQEGGYGGWWVAWMDHTNEAVTFGSENYWFFSFMFDPTSDWPIHNFCPVFNLHVDGSNPAFSGIAVSPIQLDLVGVGNGAAILTHGGGVFDPNQYGLGKPGYHDVVQTSPTNTPGSISYPVNKGIRYDCTIHAIIHPDPAIGFVEAWIAPRDGSATTPTRLCSHHCPTMYNNDPGPMQLYYGLYAKGAPAENPQVNNDNATFRGTWWAPRKGPTIPAAQANIPVITGMRGPQQLNPDIYTVASTIDGTDFMYPPGYGSGGGGGGAGGSQFGYSTKGVSTPGGVGSNFVYGSSAVLTETATVTALVAYLKGLGSFAEVFRPVIYNDSAGAPGTLVAAGPEVLVAPTDDSWKTLPMSVPGGGTLGKTASGGTNYLDDVVDIEVQGPYTLGSSGSITKITMKIGGYAAHPDCKIRAVLYSDLAGAPGSLVAVSAEKTVLSTDAVALVDFPLASPVAVVSGAKYWIGFWTNGNMNIAGDASATPPGSKYNLSQAYSSSANPPDPWTNAGTSGSSGHEYTLYATFDQTVTLTAGTYWLCLWSGATNDAANSYYDAGGAHAGFFCPVTYAQSGNPGSIAAYTYEAHINSFYALYTPATPGVPVNSAVPTITGGPPVVGSTLNGTDGTWTNSPFFSRQWFAAGVAIPGAVNSTFIPTPAEDNKTLTFQVLASNVAGSATATSSASAAVVQPAPVNLSPPVIAGAFRVGSILSVASNGVWSHMENGSFTYQWQQGTSDIGGATNPTYTVAPGDSAHTIRLEVFAHNTGSP